MLTIVIRGPTAHHEWLTPLLRLLYSNCTGQQRLVILMPRPMLASCKAHCQHASDGCECVGLRWVPELAHRSIASFTDGSSDLLYMHSDFWVNVRGLLRGGWLGANSVLPDASTSDWPRTRARGLPPMAPQDCLPLEAMAQCTGRNGNITCGGNRTWAWWSGSHHLCHQAALSVGASHCCYGWSDMLYLPAAAHTAYKAMAEGAFANVFHEVAIPTIMRRLHQGASEWGPRVTWRRVSSSRGLASPRPPTNTAPPTFVFHPFSPDHLPSAFEHLVRTQDLPCRGSCCTNAPDWGVDDHVLCAHRLFLPRVHAISLPAQRPTDPLVSRAHASHPRLPVDPHPNLFNCAGTPLTSHSLGTL